MLTQIPSFAESLPLITILSAVIGGVVLTVAAILIMILCRRSSALTLKAMGNGEKPAANSSKAMTTTGTSTMSYAAGESVDFIKSSGNGSTALLDASLANDSSQEWEGNEHEDSGSLLRKQKPILQQQNYNAAAAAATANLQMVRFSAPGPAMNN